MPREAKPVICIGSFHWDEIALSSNLLEKGDDSPGTVHKNPGGVAFNLAKTMTEFGIPVLLGSVVGDDAEGQESLNIAGNLGIDCELVCKVSGKTGKYVAIEDPQGLVAAIADCNALESNEDALLLRLTEWIKSRVGSTDISGFVIDCNLSGHFIENLLNVRYFNNFPINIASASNHKLDRLNYFEVNLKTTLYLNKLEAISFLAGQKNKSFDTAEIIQNLLGRYKRVILTDGENKIIDADGSNVIGFTPQTIKPHRITGAGDYFMAAHMALELLGYSREDALQNASFFVRDKIA
ncbi:MAG: hypothetical protein F4170_03120 [Rhodobacteraceae bacterium]|nr:hypothetical protein [Paracoccaceae bacterium]